MDSILREWQIQSKYHEFECRHLAVVASFKCTLIQTAPIKPATSQLKNLRVLAERNVETLAQMCKQVAFNEAKIKQ